MQRKRTFKRPKSLASSRHRSCAYSTGTIHSSACRCLRLSIIISHESCLRPRFTSYWSQPCHPSPIHQGRGELQPTSYSRCTHVRSRSLQSSQSVHSVPHPVTSVDPQCLQPSCRLGPRLVSTITSSFLVQYPGPSSGASRWRGYPISCCG